jgi:ribonuclease D
MNYHLIEEIEQFEAFILENRNTKWIAFDTEFMGEKRYVPLLCMIQIASENGVYLIDPLKIESLSPLLEMIQDENILKITHAGENDYRLFYQLYDITPNNVFDTQIASGFLGHGFPISFQKLAEKEVKVHIDKTLTVQDWQSRPLSNKMLEYAANDVIHLYKLYTKLNTKLIAQGKEEWAKEEFEKISEASYYETNPLKEIFGSNLLKSLSQKKQVFLVRLHHWRNDTAKQLNKSKDAIFPSKHVPTLVKLIGNTRAEFKVSRVLSYHLVDKHLDVLDELYQRKATPEEIDFVQSISAEENIDLTPDFRKDILNILVKMKCNKHKVAPTLFNIKNNTDKIQNGNGWRIKVLGPALLNLLNTEGNLSIRDEVEKLIIEIN